MLQTINNAGRASLARCAVIDVSGGCWYQVYLLSLLRVSLLIKTHQEKNKEEFSDFICSVGLTVQLYRTHHFSSLVRFKIPNPQTFVPRAPVQA